MLSQSVAEILSDHVRLTVESLDRIYLNVYVPRLQYPYGAVKFFRDHRGQPLPSSALMRPMSERFVAALDRFIASNQIPVESFAKGQRKDDVMARRLRDFQLAEGVVFVGKAQEKAKVLRTEKRRNAATGDPYPWIVMSTAMVNHYYIYAVDRDFGPFFIKFCSYFPYNARLCLNGHEYAKRQLEREGIAFTALDNGVLDCADPRRLQEICEGLSADKIDALLRKWLALLPHPFTAADRQAGYRYDVSILQAEFSTTKVFDRPARGRMFFEQVIRENLDLGRPQQVQLIFNRKITRDTPGRFRTRILTEGVTPSLHIDYKHSRIKQYHKENRALRTETTINNAADFGIAKRLSNLSKLRAVGFAANRRLLEVERLSHDCLLAEETFHNIDRPVTVEGQRASGLRFADPRVQTLWHALILFRLLPNGFRSSDIRLHLAGLAGSPPEALGQGAVSYQLRRLRLHGLIERVPGAHRYRVTDLGFRAALFFTRTYARILRPGLTCVLPGQQTIDIKLQSYLDKITDHINRRIDQARLAA
jgi:DNA-binding HxlR family transcriptional regulator